jgi:F-type H+-transporting ATPase subunit O
MAATKFGFLVRHFSTSTVAAAKLINPPIHIFGVEGRYAHALYSAAMKEKKLESVEKELKSFAELMKKEPKLAEFVVNPSIQRTVKRVALTKILEGQKFSSIVVNTFAALADNGRMNKIGSVLNSFNKIMSAHRGEVMCSVTTAKPLDQGHLRELQTALEAFIQKGETLKLETKVDPSLIGGMVVTIGDKYVDMSMATKIKTYTNLIRQAV